MTAEGNWASSPCTIIVWLCGLWFPTFIWLPQSARTTRLDLLETGAAGFPQLFMRYDDTLIPHPSLVAQWNRTGHSPHWGTRALQTDAHVLVR